jgi:RNA polymerase sigma factor (sigma-70 family)
MATSVHPIQGGTEVKRLAREGGPFCEIADAVARDAVIAGALRLRAIRVLGSRATKDRVACCVQTAWIRALHTARIRGDAAQCGVLALSALLGYLVRSVDLVGRELWDPARDPDRDRGAIAVDLEDENTHAIALVLGSSGGEDPVDRAMQAETRCRLLEALRALPPDARRVVALRYLVEMSGAEVGALDGQSLEAVRARLYRAMSQLRRVDLSDLLEAA